MYGLSVIVSVPPTTTSIGLGTIHLRRRQIFTIFNPYPPPSAVFLLLSVSKFDQFLTLPPLRNADVLMVPYYLFPFLQMKNILLWTDFYKKPDKITAKNLI